MEPIRILHVVTQMNRGGLETMLMNFYRKIDRAKIQFDFLKHRCEKGHYDDEILSMGGRIYHTYPIHPHCFFKYLSDLKKFFAEHKEYQIVHSHIDSLSAFPLRAAKRAGIPVRIAHSHNTGFDRNMMLPFRYISKSLIPGMATHLFACSKTAARFMFGDKVYTSGQYTVHNNAIETQDFIFNQNTRERVRGELGIADRFAIGHVGRFVYQKNHEFLIDVFCEVHKRQNDAVLLLVGDGPDRHLIEDKIRSLGLDSAVKFLGMRPDIPELMQAMDVFVFPSRFEGLGIVAIEAQAAGLPVIASNVLPEETTVTGLIRFLPLKEPAVVWARAVIAQTGGDRANTLAQIKSAGYDIEDSAKTLQEFYLRCARG